MSTGLRDIAAGAVVRGSRERLGVSQAHLATQMRPHGFKWSQATVWAVERGERPLRLAEAEVLAGLFDLDLDVWASSCRIFAEGLR